MTAAGVAAPAHATVCTANADVPASGSLHCVAPDELSLTVCVGALARGARVVHQEGPSLVRTTATGTRTTGTWYAGGAPVLAPGAGSCGP